jgi:cation:H+ antiporter
MLGVALLLLALLFVSKSIGRLWGLLMLALYAAYMVTLFSNGVAA